MSGRECSSLNSKPCHHYGYSGTLQSIICSLRNAIKVCTCVLKSAVISQVLCLRCNLKQISKVGQPPPATYVVSNC